MTTQRAREIMKSQFDNLTEEEVNEIISTYGTFCDELLDSLTPGENQGYDREEVLPE